MVGKWILDRWSGSSLERGQLVLLALIGVLTVASWSLTIQQAQTMDMPMGIAVSGGMDASEESADSGEMAGMPGMAMNEPGATETMSASGMSGMGWTWQGFATFLLAWAVMMTAMMFPAAAPMLLFFHKVASGHQGTGRAWGPVLIFATGYLLVWTAVGAATWVVIRFVSDIAGQFADSRRDAWAPAVLGSVLLAAGIYQFTPLKHTCLRHCQSPMGFVLTRWKAGYTGALRMGLVHGMYCLGCCWLLFAVLVGAGVMSLAWMLLLTLVVVAEKVLPAGALMGRLTGAAFVVLGIVIGAGATTLPWSA
jgi:predicted metal-binding membrane protein